MELNEVKKRLRDRNLAEVARQCGLKRQTVWLIASGTTKNPSYEHVKKLVEYLEVNP